MSGARTKGAAVALGLALLACAQTGAGREEGAGAAVSARTLALYADHCSVCHGDRGRGDGPAAPALFPPARDFTTGAFRLVSATNGVPTEADLVHVLERGVPGTAMPSWSWMGAEDLRDLAAYVRELAVQGMAEELAADAWERGAELADEEAVARARARMTPGTVVRVAAEAEATPARLALGRKVYDLYCASCHGADLRGGDEPRWNDDGTLNWARDFTAGFMKGEASAEELTRRIRCGLPGSPMPAMDLPPEELTALVTFLRSQMPAGADRRFVRTSGRLDAERTDEALPLAPTAAEWDELEERRLVLAPLAWRAESVQEVHVAAVHDGDTLCIRMRWPDDSPDSRAVAGSPLPDGAGVQLASEVVPPLVGMGTPESPVNLWHWRAFDPSGTEGLLDVLFPHEGARRSGVDAFLSVPRAPSQEGNSVIATGPDSLPDAIDSSLPISATSEYADGEWHVVFSRELGPGDGAEVPILPGTLLQVGFAVWNGSAGDHGSQKSFSVWQELGLDP